MEMTIKMFNLYDQKATIICSDDRDLLVRNLLEIFCIEEDDAKEKVAKDIAHITTPYTVEIDAELRGELLKAITDIKHRQINEVVIRSIFENCLVRTMIIKRK